MYYFIQAENNNSHLNGKKKANTAKHLLRTVKHSSHVCSIFSHPLQREKANIHFSNHQSTWIESAIL